MVVEPHLRPHGRHHFIISSLHSDEFVWRDFTGQLTSVDLKSLSDEISQRFGFEEDYLRILAEYNWEF